MLGIKQTSLRITDVIFGWTEMSGKGAAIGTPNIPSALSFSLDSGKVRKLYGRGFRESSAPTGAPPRENPADGIRGTPSRQTRSRFGGGQNRRIANRQDDAQMVDAGRFTGSKAEAEADVEEEEGEEAEEEVE